MKWEEYISEIELIEKQNNDEYDLYTVVANVNGPRIGIQFVGLDEFDRTFINKVISAKSKHFKI